MLYLDVAAGQRRIALIFNLTVTIRSKRCSFKGGLDPGRNGWEKCSLGSLEEPNSIR